MEPRLFHVAPDAIHVRLTYRPESNSWRVHAATVAHTVEGEVYSEPVEGYDDLTAEEAMDVVDAVLAGALGVR